MFEKVKISVCQSTKANGTKLKAFSGAKQEVETLHKEYKSRCIVTLSSNA